jgi:predicted transport protein
MKRCREEQVRLSFGLHVNVQDEKRKVEEEITTIGHWGKLEPEIYRM